MEEDLIIKYNWLVERQQGLNSVIAENQFRDPKKENVSLTEQNLINLGAMQMIEEIIETFKNK